MTKCLDRWTLVKMVHWWHLRPGDTTAYALKSAEERGLLFIGPGVQVYEGMVVGETTRPGDILDQCLQEETSDQCPCVPRGYGNPPDASPSDEPR